MNKISLFRSFRGKAIDAYRKEACAFAFNVITSSLDRRMKSMFELKSVWIKVVVDENLQDANKSKKILKIKFDLTLLTSQRILK